MIAMRMVVTTRPLLPVSADRAEVCKANSHLTLHALPVNFTHDRFRIITIHYDCRYIADNAKTEPESRAVLNQHDFDTLCPQDLRRFPRKVPVRDYIMDCRRRHDAGEATAVELR